jgi:hypothetical protein
MSDLPTGEQLQDVLAAALHQGDMRGVDAALTVMATVDPRRCERVMETMRLGLALAAADTPGTDTPEETA